LPEPGLSEQGHRKTDTPPALFDQRSHEEPLQPEVPLRQGQPQLIAPVHLLKHLQQPHPDNLPLSAQRLLQQSLREQLHKLPD